MLDGAADTDLELEHASMVNEGTGLRSDEESDDESEISTGPQLEPRRPHDAETPMQDFTAADTTDDDPTQADRDPSDPTHGVRGLAERQLELEPFVIPYPSCGQGVGDPVGASREQSAHANMSYELEITPDETNPYAPFASQLDWDIAKWAKLRVQGAHLLVK